MRGFGFSQSEIEKLLKIFKIFKNVHFMFSGRYGSHIQDVQEIIGRIFRITGPRPFHNFRKLEVPICEIYRHDNIFQNHSGIVPGLVEVSWCLRIIGFGSHGHVQKSKNDEGLSGSPKVKSKR